MKKMFASFIRNAYLHFIASILSIFGFFGIRSENFLDTFGEYTWIMDATKWSLILGAFLFAIHAYVRAEKNRKTLINIKTSAYDEAYRRFTKLLSYTIGRYNGYSSNLAPEERKYTKVGVLESMNEVKAVTSELFPLSGQHVRSILKEAGDEWLNDVQSFGKTAPSIMDKISEAAFKDRT